MEPDGWRSTTLAALAAEPDGLQTGPFGSQLKASEYTAEGVPVVMPKDMAGGRVITTDIARVPEDVARRLPHHRVRAGDILFGRRGELGRCALIEPRQQGWLCGTGCLRLRPDGTTLPEFLSQLFGSAKIAGWLTEHAVGQTMLNLNTEILGRLPVLVPPVPEQRKIAAILSSVDDAIEKTEAVIDQLEIVKKALLGELLTRGMPGRHKDFKETEVGSIPKAWPVVTVGEVCEKMFVGIAQAATHAYVDSGGVVIIRTTNLRANRIETSDLLRINDEFAAEMQSKRLRRGDVLTARTGYPGTSAVVPGELEGAQCFTLLVSRPGPRLLPTFLAHLMNSQIGERIVSRGQAGGAQQNLNVGVFSAANVPLPSLKEQGEIVEVMDAVDESVRTERATVIGVRALKSALLDALLSGRVRVNVGAQEAA